MENLLERYLRVLRERWPVVFGVTAATFFFAVLSRDGAGSRAGGWPQEVWIAFGLALGLAAAYLLAWIDTSIRTQEDVDRYVGLALLGYVPEVSRGDEVLLSRVPVKCPLSEIYQAAATHLQAALAKDCLRTVLVAGANPREGRTTTAINLAFALARKGLKVVLVDADLRLPQVHAMLKLDASRGLSGVLEGRCAADEALVSPENTSIATPPRVLCSGPAPKDPIPLLESDAMKRLIAELREASDVVLIDTPPVCAVSDALSLASVADAVVFVIGCRRVNREEIAHAKRLFAPLRTRPLGAVLNRARYR